MVAPTAGAVSDPCSASGLAATSSGVLNAASGYLDSHPDANTVLTAAVNQPPADAKSSVRGYFLSHVGEALESLPPGETSTRKDILCELARSHPADADAGSEPEAMPAPGA